MNDDRDDQDERLGADYYVERGCVVFTAAFLARRGWCCGNGCRHCPYEGEEKRHRSEDARRLA